MAINKGDLINQTEWVDQAAVATNEQEHEQN